MHIFTIKNDGTPIEFIAYAGMCLLMLKNKNRSNKTWLYLTYQNNLTMTLPTYWINKICQLAPCTLISHAIVQWGLHHYFFRVYFFRYILLLITLFCVLFPMYFLMRNTYVHACMDRYKPVTHVLPEMLANFVLRYFYYL